MRKFVAWTLIGVMAVSLCGCGKKEDTKNTETTEGTTEEVVEETEETEESTQEVATDGNLILNGDFSGNLEGWQSYTNGGQGSIAIQNEELVVSVDKIGDLNYCVQANVGGFGLDQGVVYEFSFDIKCDIEREFEWRIQMNSGDYHAYVGDPSAVATTDYTTVSTTFTMEEGSDPAPKLCFNLGNHVGAEPGVEPHKIYIDNVSLKVLDESGKAEAPEEVEENTININQVGYMINDTKIAVFRGEDVDKEFTVVNTANNEVVYTGTIDDMFANKTADETNYYGDFSNVTEPGNYKIVTENMGESYTFDIGDDVYNSLYSDVVNMLYLQRCGTALSEEEAGEFAHKACHTSKARIYGTEKFIDVSGGWHDAGDYGRYVVSGAKTVADLLLTVEDFDEENKKALLNEAKYELDWMFKMQDSATGGVYHKVTCAVFPGDVMPEEETDELIVAPISTTATGDYAAVMAMAAHVYKDSNSKFANKCLKASKAAYAYLEENLTAPNYSNPSDILTGEYGDNSCRDEYFWAAAELYKATGQEEYLTVVKNIIENKNLQGLGWADVGTYGLYAYLTTDLAQADSSNTYKKATDKLLACADELLEASQKDGYMVALGDSYPWGSNMSVANDGMVLLMANKLQANDKYVLAAKQQLDYLLGVNATGYCFVTGYGTVSPEHTHHRPSTVVGESMVGMLVGGPDSALEDPYAQQVLKDKAPSKCYADNNQSYSCNEVTVYWNSPLIYLIAGAK